MRVFASAANQKLQHSIIEMHEMNDGGCPNAAFSCNRVLAALPEEIMLSLVDHLEFVYLESGREVCAENRKPTHVYFPTTAVFALLHRTADGAALEMGVIGREGAVGCPILYDKGVGGAVMVQFAGGAYRARMSVIEDAGSCAEHLQQLLVEYSWSFLANVLQSSMDWRHWSIDQRLSCWLLERLDRLTTAELKATQEMIAGMLGVRRESITESIGRLQKSGLVRCRRGTITVLDRERLESLSDGCYRGSACHAMEFPAPAIARLS